MMLSFAMWVDGTEASCFLRACIPKGGYLLTAEVVGRFGDFVIRERYQMESAA
jgi:hypothetical protein